MLFPYCFRQRAPSEVGRKKRRVFWVDASLPALSVVPLSFLGEVLH